MPWTNTPSSLRVSVLGGTGYTGSAVVRALVERGHTVTAISRSTPTEAIPGVTHVAGTVLDEALLRRAVDDADAVLSALSPRGELAGQIARVNRRLAELAAAAGIRIGVVGGFSALRPAPGAPRMAEGDDLPPEIADEAKEMLAVLVTLLATPATVDWFLVSPSMGYGAGNPAEKLGTWRIGTDVADFSPEHAPLSAPDLAGAIVAELENPAHRRSVFSVTS